MFTVRANFGNIRSFLPVWNLFAQPAFLCALILTRAALPAHSAEPPPAPARPAPWTNGQFILRQGDVVAFIGGADVAGALHTGHLEALLAVSHPKLELRFRNFGWEGDTVFAQPRDIGFPPLPEHLRRAGVTVAVLQFGRAEALEGHGALPRFIAAYEKLLEDCAKVTPRLVLVTPPPFERATGMAPDLGSKNASLRNFADALRELARRRELPLVDALAALNTGTLRGEKITDNGLQLTARGQALFAHAFLGQLGSAALVKQAGEPNALGAWPNVAMENLRRAVVEKNQLWFHYWRPQNWAFLGGDRTSQPSSRDHRDPKTRWFPEEMEKFLPLIAAKEKQIAELANGITAQ